MNQTPEQALQVLDSAASQLNASREVHVQIQAAVNVLRLAIADQISKAVEPSEPSDNPVD